MNLQQNQAISKNVQDDLLDDDLEIESKSGAKSIDDDNPIDDSPNDDFGEDYYSDMSNPSTMQKFSDLLKDLTDFEPTLKEVVNGWLGMTWNNHERRFEKNGLIEPIMNLKGAMWCITYLKTYAKKTNFITNISEKEYEWLYWDINRVVWIDFATRDDFGVKSNQDYHRVGMELVHGAILVLTGAGGGKYNQFFGSTTQRTEHINMGNAQQMVPMGMQGMQKKRVGLFGMAKRMLVGGQ